MLNIMVAGEEGGQIQVEIHAASFHWVEMVEADTGVSPAVDREVPRFPTRVVEAVEQIQTVGISILEVLALS